ncbi:hypothetical protein ACFQUX_17615 [Pantoea stewartii]
MGWLKCSGIRISYLGRTFFRQREALESEGVEVTEAGQIDLAKFRWQF